MPTPSVPDSTQYVVAIDQGTTSTRCMVFDAAGGIVSSSQTEHRQIFPQAGWVEHDAVQVWRNTRTVCAQALAQADLDADDIAAVGITNQRETCVVWNKRTGKPIYNAIVWQDTRTTDLCERLTEKLGADVITARTGLPVATYFSGPKVQWILENVVGAREAADAGELLFGTMDTWLLWNLTGGVRGGIHVTDVTNASRTLMMDIETLQWDDDLVQALNIPLSMLPEIRSSSEVYGNVQDRGPLRNVPIAGILGDQQAATFGQACFEAGSAKNTYGTGNFLLLNTGADIVRSEHGLLTTVCYQLKGQPAVYALEGSIAVTGSLVQWLRDNLGLIKTAAEIETHAKTVENNGDVYVVPAFSGLFAPYWRSDARGAIVGLTRFANRGHICRAALEAVAFQTCEVVDAMNADSDVDLTALKVDGGMVVNDTLMQIQADLLGVDVVRPKITETTALGAAYAAGIAVGFWGSLDELSAQWAQDVRFEPRMDTSERQRLIARWKQAVERTFDWA